jgi:hypothetical protein
MTPDKASVMAMSASTSPRVYLWFLVPTSTCMAPLAWSSIAVR